MPGLFRGTSDPDGPLLWKRKCTHGRFNQLAAAALSIGDRSTTTADQENAW